MGLNSQVKMMEDLQGITCVTPWTDDLFTLAGSTRVLLRKQMSKDDKMPIVKAMHGREVMIEINLHFLST